MAVTQRCTKVFKTAFYFRFGRGKIELGVGLEKP